MKKIEHRQFLKNNKLDKKELFQPIGDKIEIFDRMYDLLEEVQPSEHKKLLNELKALDLEIMEDLDEIYAEMLTFNCMDEAIEDTPVQKKVETKEITTKQDKQEAILENLVAKGRTKNITRSTLRELGITKPLYWKTQIGKYVLVRASVFRYTYHIESA